MALFASLSPIRLKCKGCGSALVGESSVTRQAIVETLVVGAVVLAAFVWEIVSRWSAIVVPLSVGEQRTIYQPGIGFLAAAVLIPAIWLVGLFVYRRLGRYSLAREDQVRVPRSVRVYIAATGVLSIVLLAVMSQYAGFSTSGEVVLVSFVLAPFLILFPLYADMLGPWTGNAITTALLVWAGIVALFGPVFTVYAVANYPRESGYQEEMYLSARRLSEQDAWRTLVELTNAPSPDRASILELVSQNIVSVPDDDYQFTPFTDTSGPGIFQLPVFMTAELEEVRRLVVAGDLPAANARYIRLWRVARNLATGNILLIQVLFAHGVSIELVQFYLEQESALRGSAGEIAPLVEALMGGLDEVFANTMVGEYLYFRYTLENINEVICGQAVETFLEQACPIWEPGWPFYDKESTLKIYHDYIATVARLAGEPFYQVQNELEQAREKGEGFSNAFSLIKNPFGSALVAALIPQMAGFVDNDEALKPHLAAFIYILGATASGSLDNVPIDPRSGDPFVVSVEGGTVKISGDGQPPLHYEFTRP